MASMPVISPNSKVVGFVLLCPF